MRRKALLRRTPMKRTWMRRSHGATKYSRRERHIEHMMVVKSLPCVARDLSPCEGVIEADHAGRRGIGQKCDDRETVSLCTLHHHHRTNFSGPFRNWKQEQMRSWLVAKIEETQAKVLAELAR